MKVSEDNPSKWPYIIEGILFTHRVSCHASTKYSRFKLMYNRDPLLPIDVKHNLLPCGEGQDPFDKETFDAVLSTALKTSIVGICQALVFVSGKLYCYEIIDVTIGKRENLHLSGFAPIL